MKDKLLMLCSVYKIVVGLIGVVCTVVWFSALLLGGMQAAIVLNDSEVLSTIGASAVILGNGYAMFKMVTSGLNDLRC